MVEPALTHTCKVSRDYLDSLPRLARQAPAMWRCSVITSSGAEVQWSDSATG